MNTKDWADQAVAELPALCTSGEAAAFLRVSVRQLYRYLSVGKLPALQRRHQPVHRLWCGCRWL